MPLFNFFGWWDSYLSAALYSGNTLVARVHISDAVVEKLPPAVREKHHYFNQLSVTDWALAELNVPPYPARRVYRGIARRLAALDPAADAVSLVFDGRPNWRTGERATTSEKIAP